MTPSSQRPRPGIWLILFGLLFAWALGSYLTSYPIPEFKEKMTGISGGFFLILSLVSIGFYAEKLLRRLFKHEIHSQPIPVQLVLHGGLGYGFLSLIILFLGSCQIGSLSGKFTLLIFLLAILCLSYLAQRRSETTSDTTRQGNQFNTEEVIILFLGAAGGMVSFITCFSPITYYDSLVYHLALPAYYHQTGSVSPLPFNLYSFFPQNAEMIYLLALNRLPQAETVINLLNWFTSLATSVLLYFWAKEMGDRRCGLLAWSGWWTMPAAMLLSVGGYVDVTLAFFISLSLYSFSLYHQSGQNRYWLMLAGLFSGFAMGTKYTGGIVIGLIMVTLILQSAAKGKQKRLSHLFLFGFAVIMPTTPWLIRNWLSVGNPIFPFLYTWFDQSKIGWTANSASGYFQALTEYGAKSNMLFELFIAPWRIASSTLTFGGGFDVLGDFGWLPFVFLPLLILFVKPTDRRSRFLFLLAAGYFMVWLFTKPVLRFLIGALPLAVLLSAIGIERLLRNKEKLTTQTAYGLLFLCVISNFFMYFFIQSQLQSFSVALGQEDRTSYLRRRLSFYPTFDWLNKTPINGNAVLIIGEQRTYHLKIPFISSNLFASSPIAEVCNNAKNTSDIASFLREKAIQFVLLNEGEIERLGGMEKFGFTDNGRQIFAQYLSTSARLLTEDRRVKIYSNLTVSP